RGFGLHRSLGVRSPVLRSCRFAPGTSPFSLSDERPRELVDEVLTGFAVHPSNPKRNLEDLLEVVLSGGGLRCGLAHGGGPRAPISASRTVRIVAVHGLLAGLYWCGWRAALPPTAAGEQVR